MSNQSTTVNILARAKQIDKKLSSHQTHIDVNLDEMYARTVAEMTLQQTKRDQIIASYLTVLSLVTSVAVASKDITAPMRGGFFLAAGAIGILLALIIIRYRVYKEAYWLCCQTLSVMFGYKKEDINKELIQDIYRATMLKKGKGYTVPVSDQDFEEHPAFKLKITAPKESAGYCTFQLLDGEQQLLQTASGNVCSFRILWDGNEQKDPTKYIIRTSYVQADNTMAVRSLPISVTFSRKDGKSTATAVIEDRCVSLERSPDLRFSKRIYVKKNRFSAETIYLFIQALICATVTSLGWGYLLQGIGPVWLQWALPIGLGIPVLVGLVWQYFAKCISVYQWLIDGEEASFNGAFGKAWLLHFYH